MTKRAFWFGVAAVALALPAAGCDELAACKETCIAQDACAEFPPETPCETRCKVEQDLVKAALCEEQKKDYDTCRDQAADICTFANTCLTQVKAYNDCIGDFCAVDPAACADYCKDFPSACGMQ